MSAFATDLIAWQRTGGRHDLPWQNTTDPYRIWVSEIMLQQTQVSAVVDRYKTFLARFPDVHCLAAATQEEVLACWSGLGYYSRARNLHAAAQTIVTRHRGRFPLTAADLAGLPGIGRSTAAAVACFAGTDAQAILDGNVKRVLARVFAVEGWPGRAEVERRLWQLADELLPRASGYEALRDYTQGLMDLGATLCTPRDPRCGACPIAARCQARATDRVRELPAPRPARTLVTRLADWALILSGARVLLEVRPARGLWGGLWALPEIRSPSTEHQIHRLDANAVSAWLQHHPALTGQSAGAQAGIGRRAGIAQIEALEPAVRHAFTHFRLEARVWKILPADVAHPYTDQASDAPAGEHRELRWLSLKPESIAAAPLPTPVRRLLSTL
ncbi:MAG: A/G-specific adenine glycosylase [Pseudomonadota bacterium]|jgi:A/G-specific adenine glycosylase